jgi:CheY-like chemotaxis protein
VLWIQESLAAARLAQAFVASGDFMPIIAVLEDDQRRISAMREAVRADFSEFDLRIFVSAPEMIEWLTVHLPDVLLISLDRDLDASAVVDAGCGSGEDVTAYLVRNMPSCPVLIHSSNAMRAPAMHMELAMAGCQQVVLCPFQDSEQWAADIHAALGDA